MKQLSIAKIKFVLFFVYILCVLLIMDSCKKDATGTRELFAYPGSGNAAQNMASGYIYFLRDARALYDKSPVFPVLLSRAVTSDISVSAVIDTSLLASYDSANKTTSPRFPAKAFGLASSEMIVKSGQTSSQDSIRLTVSDTTGLDFSKTYIVPIRLDMATGNAAISPSRKSMFCKISLYKVSASLAGAATLTPTAARTAKFTTGPVIQFPAALNVAINKPVDAEVTDDPALVTAYNQANQTSFKAFPQGAYRFVKSKVTIAANNALSADSISIAVDNLSLFNSGEYYILGVRMKDNADVNLDKTNSVKYIKLIVRDATVSIPSTGSAQIDISISRTAAGQTLPVIATFSGLLNYAFPFATSAYIQYDASLVAAYNASNNKSYSVMPDNSFTLAQDSVNFASGATTSLNTFKIDISNPSLLATGVDYVLPVRLRDNNSLTPDLNKKIVYVHLNVFINNVDPSNAGLTGITSDRSKWTVTTSSINSATYTGTKMLDANNSTAWISSTPLPQWFKLDLGASKTIKGFLLVPCYVATAYNILAMDVESSMDGINWNMEGKYNGALPAAGSSAANPDIKTVRFVAPVTGRYFRFTATSSGTTSGTGVGEINMVE